MAEIDPELDREPAHLPERGDAGPGAHLPHAHERGAAEVQLRVRGRRPRRLSDGRGSVRRIRRRSASLKGIRKTFPGFTAIEELDLLIPAGSFFALLGPSGCGKTTTLRLVAGLEDPTAGRILIGGAGRHRGEAAQAPGQHGVPELRAVPAHDGDPERRVRSAAAQSGRCRSARRTKRSASSNSTTSPRRRPSQLSGGQQQRVALARAIVNRPALLLLDEPLGALDLKLRRQMQLELKSIQAEVGLTFLHVTHDQEEAMTMADTVAVMNHGSHRAARFAPGALRAAADRRSSRASSGSPTSSRPTSSRRSGGLITARTAGGVVAMPHERAVVTSGAITVGVRPGEAAAPERRARPRRTARTCSVPGGSWTCPSPARARSTSS